MLQLLQLLTLVVVVYAQVLQLLTLVAVVYAQANELDDRLGELTSA